MEMLALFRNKWIILLLSNFRVSCNITLKLMLNLAIISLPMEGKEVKTN